MRRGLLVILVAGATLAAGFPALADAASTAWSVQTVPLPPNATFGNLDAVSCSTATSCVAVGVDNLGPGLLAEVWNGDIWMPQSPPAPAGATFGALQAVSCISATSCTASGFYAIGYGDLPLAESWNGNTWTAQIPPNPRAPAGVQNAFLSAISCTSASSCVAGGSYLISNPSTRRLIAEVWNGSTWTLQHVPTPPGTQQDIAGISCVAATICTAVGSYFPSAVSNDVLIDVWNGSTWTRKPAPIPAGDAGLTLTGVSCPAADSCTAVGDGFGSATSGQLAAEHWNGSHWTAQNIPLAGGASRWELAGVSCGTPASCIAVGQDYPAAMADRSNGHTWFVQLTAAPKYGKEFNAVSCLATAVCTAVGDIRSGRSTELPLAEQN